MIQILKWRVMGGLDRSGASCSNALEGTMQVFVAMLFYSGFDQEGTQRLAKHCAKPRRFVGLRCSIAATYVHLSGCPKWQEMRMLAQGAWCGRDAENLGHVSHTMLSKFVLPPKFRVPKRDFLG